jgi:hypothetical protein
MNNIKHNTQRPTPTQALKINLRWILEDLHQKQYIDDLQYKNYCKKHKVTYQG